MIFLSEHEIRTTNAGRNYVLLTPFQFSYKGFILTIPAGFESDWASVPRFLWRIFPPHFYPKSSLCHDFLYASEYDRRTECDRFFRDGLKEEGASLVKRNAMFQGVYLFGWTTWSRHDILQVNELRKICGFTLLGFKNGKGTSSN